MKKQNIFIIIAFFAIILLPIITFNTKSDAISEIDNRKLAKDPYTVWLESEDSEMESEDTESAFNMNDALTAYISDRLGFRNQLITAYDEVYDELFHVMKHPSYMYGKDGYVFFKSLPNTKYTTFHDEYIDMIADIQQYCEERDVACYFMFEPNKESVLTQYLPDGVNYDRSWADEMLYKMQERGINVVDNTELLSNLEKEGVSVFNKQYDAGHWNEYGAYYGTNNLLYAMRLDGLDVSENRIEDFEVSEELQTSLPSSKFAISEMTPVIDTGIDSLIDKTSKYEDEIELNKAYPYFVNYVNKNCDNSLKLMLFQGSYMNHYGYKFMGQAFSEYIGIHDYENTINFQYYYNVFKPDVVVIEVAEYACTAGYFNMASMERMRLNSVLDKETIESEVVSEDKGLMIEKGDSLTKIKWIQESFDSFGISTDNPMIWLLIDGDVYDMEASSEDGVAYQCSVKNTSYNSESTMEVVVDDGYSIIKVCLPAVESAVEEMEYSAGVEKTGTNSFHIETTLKGNKFSQVVIQVQNVETGEYLEPIDSRKAKGTYECGIEKYTHNAESGEYLIIVKGNTNLQDEWINYRCYLSKGETYYLSYSLDDFSSTDIYIRDFTFAR